MSNKQIIDFQKDLKIADFVVMTAIRRGKADYYSGRIVEIKKKSFALATSEGVLIFQHEKVQSMYRAEWIQ